MLQHLRRHGMHLLQIQLPILYQLLSGLRLLFNQPTIVRLLHFSHSLSTTSEQILRQKCVSVQVLSLRPTPDEQHPQG